MEKMLKPYDREHMKMAMLKHEEIFKQQVNELHRLYRIQKTLMKGVENNKQKQPNQQRLNCSSKISLNQANDTPQYFHKKPRPEINLDHPIEEYIRYLDENKELDIEGESEIQLTLGLTPHKIRNKIDTSDSGTSFSSSSTGSSHITKEANQGLNQDQENLARCLTMVTSNSNYKHPKKIDYRVQDQPNQGRLNQPPWRLQALSLNMS